MSPPSGLVVDHIYRNPLDNRRKRLRLCTPAENNYNTSPKRNGTSRFKGVHRCKRTGKWRVHVGGRGKKVYLGAFGDEVEAARTYDEYAREACGEFAYLNPV